MLVGSIGREGITARYQRSRVVPLFELLEVEQIAPNLLKGNIPQFFCVIVRHDFEVKRFCTVVPLLLKKRADVGTR